jgi:MFS transporter, MHS family, proline/betaine transporter
MICTWIANDTCSRFLPAYYVMVAAVIALACILYFRTRAYPAATRENVLKNA